MTRGGEEGKIYAYMGLHFAFKLKKSNRLGGEETMGHAGKAVGETQNTLYV